MSCACGKPGGGCADATPRVPEIEGDSGCSGSESFALQVLGDDMRPEFDNGDIIIVEPDGTLVDGSYVLARWADEWLFRQLRRKADGDDGERGEGWQLHQLNPAAGESGVLPIPDLSVVHGVVIQKAVPGRRRASKFYV
ncbi:MAG: S24 family peptidase [Burkholderiales bacterium]|nr:S24 family peptidase [Burkholderiales bacterium]